MRRTLARLLETPERGTAKWKAITVVKAIPDTLMIVLTILILAKMSGVFTLPEGPAEPHFNLGIALYIVLMYSLVLTLSFVVKVAKKIVQRTKDGENV